MSIDHDGLVWNVEIDEIFIIIGDSRSKPLPTIQCQGGPYSLSICILIPSLEQKSTECNFLMIIKFFIIESNENIADKIDKFIFH